MNAQKLSDLSHCENFVLVHLVRLGREEPPTRSVMEGGTITRLLAGSCANTGSNERRLHIVIVEMLPKSYGVLV
jgi:hypothetical protein